MSTDTTITDVRAEIAALITAFFAAVSFEEGERPRYERIHDHFIDGGWLIKNSGATPESCSVEEFIRPRQQTVDAGELTSFYEGETAEITEIFGNVAHRLSPYEKRGTAKGESFAGRGVISTQFIRTPSGWKISSMAWDDERPGLALPDRYR